MINHEAVSLRTTVSLAGLGFPAGRIVDVENGNEVPQTRAHGNALIQVDTTSGVTRLFHVLPSP